MELFLEREASNEELSPDNWKTLVKHVREFIQKLDGEMWELDVQPGPPKPRGLEISTLLKTNGMLAAGQVTWPH